MRDEKAGEPFGKEALFFTKELIMHREVSEICTMCAFEGRDEHCIIKHIRTIIVIFIRSQLFSFCMLKKNVFSVQCWKAGVSP